ncbi:MAG: hypothetical protein QM770_00055 [Tepidisphaeraceae bacterium]
MLPVLTNALKPTFSLNDQSRMAVQSAGLTDERDVARPGNVACEGGVQTRQRVHHAQAIRADDAHPAAAGLREQLSFQFDARRAQFLEACTDDDGRLHAGVGALADDAGNARGGRCDDGEVDLLRHLADFRVCLDAQHAGPFRIDGEHRAAERRLHQVPQ